jgi:ketosteroid isomerase-like protein
MLASILRVVRILGILSALSVTSLAYAQEPDQAIHEELRGILRAATDAINSGQYDKMLPYMTENVEATSVTQEVMSSRDGVSKYFQEWFGPTGYMRSMRMTLEPDALTELAPDKSWGLVRGTSREHYEAKDGGLFDFVNRWTAVMIRDVDGRWRLRAIHFGTNDLDNPVLTRVQQTLMRYTVAASIACLILGAALGWWLGGRRARVAAAAR